MRPRLLLPVLLSMMLFVLAGGAAWADSVSFNDTQSHWASQEIKLVYARGIMLGVGNGLFAPEQPLTRAQLVVSLVKEFGLSPAGAAGSQFTAAYDDVPKTAWYADAAVICAANHIFSVDGRSFNPQAPVTRLETAVAVARCFTASKLQAPAMSAQASYADTKNVGPDGQAGISLVTYSGIMRGYGGYFRPGDRLTRAEAACVLSRANEVIRLKP
ncbi:MAG: S-layer homology domain-containing protein [Thermacetogeniaceae bacterium]